MRDKDTGAISEIQVASKLIELGYTVSVPINDGKYDLVAERDGVFYRIQVKHGRLKNGAVRVTLCEYTNGEAFVYTREDIDAFGIYNEDHGVFFIDIDDAPDKLMHIRVETAENKHPSIRRGEDYRKL